MSIGRRVARIRASHGESLREAAVRTGVSHTTIARIEKGEVTGSFYSTLRKIADGYGVKLEYLLTGRDPRHDFEVALRRLPPEERSRLYFASARARVKMVLDFLMAEYPQEFSMEQLAEAAGIDPERFMRALDDWHSDGFSEETCQQLGEVLSRVTGISPHWFRCGALDGETAMTKESVSAYLHLVKKAAQAGIQPQMLEIAIDLLIMKNNEAATSVS
jgi:transcriptional regulator with XRE-family HTH domain